MTSARSHQCYYTCFTTSKLQRYQMEDTSVKHIDSDSPRAPSLVLGDAFTLFSRPFYPQSVLRVDLKSLLPVNHCSFSPLIVALRSNLLPWWVYFYISLLLTRNINIYFELMYFCLNIIPMSTLFRCKTKLYFLKTISC